jgi:hypothetical protein
MVHFLFAGASSGEGGSSHSGFYFTVRATVLTATFSILNETILVNFLASGQVFFILRWVCFCC